MTSPDLRSEVLAELEAMLSSREFARSQRLCRFLRFVVERTLAGDPESLKESIIGAEVFDRPPDYDPKTEPIVRTEARRLRRKIDQYYQDQGRDTTLRIAVPTGGYSAEFIRATPPVPVRRLLEMVALPSRTGSSVGHADRSALARVEEDETENEAENEAEPVAATLVRLPGRSASRPQASWILLGISLLMTAALAGALVWSLSRREARPLRAVPLTALPHDEFFPSLSPDGTEVVFSWAGEREENIDLYLQRVDGGPAHRLTTDPAREEYASWAPNGKWIAFVRALRDVVIVSPLDGEERKIAETTWHTEALRWTPDGSSVIVPVYREGSGDLFDLDAVDVSTGERTRLNRPEDPVCAVQPFAYSPDGKLFAFTRRPAKGSGLEIFVRPAQGGASTQITHWNRSIEGWAWTPDSREIVFSSDRNGPFTLWRVSPYHASDQPELVAGIGNDAVYPVLARYAPGASGTAPSELVFEHVEQTANFSEYEIVSDASGKPASLASRRMLFPSTREDSAPQFSSDGKQMVFISTRSGYDEIWIGTLATGSVRMLTSLGPDNLCPRSPRWSSDDRMIAFSASVNRQVRFEHALADIYTIPVGGGPVRRLTNWNSETIWPWWAHDGKSMYVTSDRAGSPQIWKMPVGTTSAPVQLTFSGGFNAMDFDDGARILFRKGRMSSDVWEMPGGGTDVVARRIAGGVLPAEWWAVNRKGLFYVDTEKSGIVAYPEEELKPVFFMPWNTGTAQRIGGIPHRLMTGRADFTISPDGRHLVYSHLVHHNIDLMIVHDFH